MISSVAILSRRSLSADSTMRDENQSSLMVQRRRFLIILTLLIARSALQLGTGTEFSRLSRYVRVGKPDNSVMTRRGLINPFSVHFRTIPSLSAETADISTSASSKSSTTCSFSHTHIQYYYKYTYHISSLFINQCFVHSIQCDQISK